MGFIFDSMRNSYLQSSHFLVSELLIHLCRQLWWTYCKDPAHKHGEIRGWSGSASQWHILQISTDEATEVIEMLFLGGAFGLSLLFSVDAVICPSNDFGFKICKDTNNTLSERKIKKNWPSLWTSYFLGLQHVHVIQSSERQAQN